jgi:hypothetical protein
MNFPKVIWLKFNTSVVLYFLGPRQPGEKQNPHMEPCGCGNEQHDSKHVDRG